MNRPSQILIAAALLLTVSAGRAQSDYDYFEFSYDSIVIDIDRNELEGDGFGFSLSKDFADRFLLLAGFEQYAFDVADDFDMKQDLYRLGVGYHFPASDKFDVYGKLLYSATDSELTAGPEWDDGVEAVLGLRLTPFHEIHLDASLNYVGYEDPISLNRPELSVSGLMRWYMTEAASIGLGANYGEYEYSWIGNIRIDFGGRR